jgi:hypothetical protein
MRIAYQVFYLPIFFSFFFFLSIVSQNCGSKRFPDWIENPYKEFKSSEFIVGVGAGYDKDGADNSARADIIKQIQVKIKETFEEKSVLEKYQGTEKSGEYATRKMEGKIEGILEGVIIKERFLDKKSGIWYSLAVLDVGKFSREKIKKISQIEGDILLNIRKIEEYMANSEKIDTTKIIENLSKIDSGIQNMRKEISTLELFGKSYSSIVERKFSELIDELSNISIKISGGNSYFSSPLTIISFDTEVKFQEKPVAWMPLEAQIKGVFGETKIKIITDENGKSRISEKVFAVPGENQIIIKTSTPYIRASKMERLKFDSGTIFVESKYELLKNEISRCLNSANLKIEQKEDNAKLKVIADISKNPVYQGKDFKGNQIYISEVAIKISIISKDGITSENQFYGKGIGQNIDESEKKALEQAIKSMCQPTAIDYKSIKN